MDGVFINLTGKKLLLSNNQQISANTDLVTPISKTGNDSNSVNGTGENGDFSILIPLASEHIKYPFREDQIEKINNISRGRTRLFILEKDDAIFWSIGRFKCPFRNYRLFTWDHVNTINGSIDLIEYPIPKTYLDYMVSSVGSALTASKKLIVNIY